MILIVTLGLTVLITVALIYGSRRWESATKEMRAKLEAARRPIGRKTYSPDELIDLPAPVHKYFQAVLKDGQPIVSAVSAELSGTINMSATGEKWKRSLVTVFGRPLCSVPPPDLSCRSGEYRHASLPDMGPQNVMPISSVISSIPQSNRTLGQRLFAASRCGIAGNSTAFIDLPIFGYTRRDKLFIFVGVGVFHPLSRRAVQSSSASRQLAPTGPS